MCLSFKKFQYDWKKKKCLNPLEKTACWRMVTLSDLLPGFSLCVL
jgi:hypothetical protein